MRKLYSTPSFDSAVKAFSKHNRQCTEKIQKTLKKLEQDIFDASLDMHKLHGDLKDFYACKVSYEIRILFTFDEKSVTLHDIGTHDQIY
jgi:addiction module RelE/StbE family toxin